MLTTLTACATLTADATQKITVITTPAGAHCYLRNDEGRWEIAKTPDSAMVKRAFSKLAIECQKTSKGMKLWLGEATLEATTRNRAYGNILLGGVPALVDAYTGDGYEYEQPNVMLTLERIKK